MHESEWECMGVRGVRGSLGVRRAWEWEEQLRGVRGRSAEQGTYLLTLLEQVRTSMYVRYVPVRRYLTPARGYLT